MSRGFGNRGKSFEQLIQKSNHTYARKKWGYIEKAEPAVKVKSKRGKFITGWFEGKGFVDYFGISNGRALAFEAKSTRERNRFPLDNVKKHQVDALEFWHEQGGVAFILVEFFKYKEVYFVPYDLFYPWWHDQFHGGRKSIPYDWFIEHCDLVKADRGVLLDYLGVVNLP